MYMTATEKEMQIALGTYLPMKWAEGYKLRAEGYKLYEEGHKLHTKGEKLYEDAVIEVYGIEAVDNIDWHTGEVKVEVKYNRIG